MECTNGNCEPKHGGLLDFHRALGTGALSETAIESEVYDSEPDGLYKCCEEMDLVIRELDSVERICEAIIKKFQGPEGPLTSQSDVSQCSIENTAAVCLKLAKEDDKQPEVEKKRKGKFVPPLDVVDLTSDDGSCDSSIARRDQELSEPGQVQSPLATSMVTGITALWSPPVSPVEKSPWKRKHPDPPEFTDLSDDDNNIRYQPYEWGNPAQAQVRTTRDEDDALADVWQEMERALHASGAVPTIVGARVKRRKVNTATVVSREISEEYPPMQLGSKGNEFLYMEISPRPALKKGRGRPRKDSGTPHELVECTGQATKERAPIKPKNLQIGVEEAAHTQADTQKSPKQGKERKRRKGEESCKRGQVKKCNERGEEELTEDDDVDEDKENRRQMAKQGNAELHEEQSRISSNVNGERVEYEPYMRRDKNENRNDEDAKLEDLFNEMKTAMASTLGPYPDMMTSEIGMKVEDCDHKNFDFDEKVGYYCEDCGSVRIDMPTSETTNAKSKGCDHKSFEFDDEVGYYCPDCGHVGRDIQHVYRLSETPKSVRKQQVNKQEAADGVSQFQLKLQDSSTNVFYRADLQLHPFFEERLHAHQKKGFKFLIENLLGDRQQEDESVGCVLAHAPGTGKTFLMISFIQSFLAKFPEGRPLILAPKIILNSWLKEFDNWKVEEIPIYNLNECTRDSNFGDGSQTGFEEEEEEYARLPSHITKSLKESRARVLRDWQGGRGVLLISYTLFAILVSNGVEETVLPESLDYQISKVLLEAPNLVILDEGHLARNIKTKISQSLIAMETKRRVLLSGTLFQNNFKELYTLLKLCRDNFMTSHPQYGKRITEVWSNLHGPKYSSFASPLERRSKKELMQVEERIFSEEIGDRLESYVKSGEARTDEIECVVKKLQSLTASFVDWYPGEILKSLPGLFEYSVHLNLTQIQQQTIAQLSTGHQRWSHMSRQCMLLAACIHPSLVNRGEDVNTPFAELNVCASSLEKEAFKGVKMTFLLQLLARCLIAEEKLLIFCSTLTPLKYIEDLFCTKWSWSKGQEILRLDGTMQESERQKVIDLFNSKETNSYVLLASIKACKEGITLVGASRIVIIDNPDNPSVVRQAVSRAFRIGQKKKVFVYRLVTTNREEEDIFRRSVNKERLSQVLLDPVSTMARMGGFLQELSSADVEDELLQTMIQNDSGKYINVINRYNAARSL